MKFIKILLLLVLPIFSLANIEYINIDKLESVKEGNITRITRINNQTFEYFRIYIDNLNTLNKDCLVKFDTDTNDFTLSSGKPFMCNNKPLELLNKNISNFSEIEPFVLLKHTLIYQMFLPNIGKNTTLLLFLFTFLLYLTLKRGEILFIGIFISILVGIIIGISNSFNEKEYEYPYGKEYLVEYYDQVDKKNNFKVFRRGFYMGNILKDNNNSISSTSK